MFIYPRAGRRVAEHAVKAWIPGRSSCTTWPTCSGSTAPSRTPFAEGADIVTGSTHKTFFGPAARRHRLSNFDKDHPCASSGLDVKSRAFPGSTSNHHLGTLLGPADGDLRDERVQERVPDPGAQERQGLRQGAEGRRPRRAGRPGRRLHRDPPGARPRPQHGTGEQIARRLEENNIVCNYQALPDDESFLVSSGLRTASRR